MQLSYKCEATKKIHSIASADHGDLMSSNQIYLHRHGPQLCSRSSKILTTRLEVQHQHRPSADSRDNHTIFTQSVAPYTISMILPVVQCGINSTSSLENFVRIQRWNLPKILNYRGAIRTQMDLWAAWVFHSSLQSLHACSQQILPHPKKF